MSDTAFHVWIDPLSPVAISGKTLFIEAPPSIRSWVKQRFTKIISREVKLAIADDVSVEIVDRPSLPDQNIRSRDSESTHALDRSPNSLADLNPKYSFDQFVIGSSNRFAHASALSVAESPAQAFNPLFIHSSNGLGKTHLIQSIANFLLIHSPGLNVVYTTVESFTNNFVSALRGGSISSFKNRFRKADVLLVDDVQFLEGKKSTQEEFFHTFNALYELGSQLVLTSDQSPQNLDPLHERLKSRFGLGLSVEILQPDFDTRFSILKKRASIDQIPNIDDSVFNLIADRITGNIRSLEGALIRIVAYASLKQCRPSIDLASDVLDSLYGSTDRPPSIVDFIKDTVSSDFGVSIDDLSSSRRSRDVTLPRHIAMYLARELTDHSLPRIAREFNRKDHTTVLNATDKISGLISSDPDIKSSVDSCINRVKTRFPQDFSSSAR